MKPRSRIVLWACLTVLCGAPCSAQPLLDPGTRVRLLLRSPMPDSLGARSAESRASVVIGAVQLTEGTAMEVFLDVGAQQRIPLADVVRIEVSRGPGTRAGLGALVGGLLGSVVVINAQLGGCARSDEDVMCVQGSRATQTMLGAVGGGLVVGALIGSNVRGPERWREVWPRAVSARKQSRVP
jgi:hypothetical protein